jgi:hypothetical protein
MVSLIPIVWLPSWSGLELLTARLKMLRKRLTLEYMESWWILQATEHRKHPGPMPEEE